MEKTINKGDTLSDLTINNLNFNMSINNHKNYYK